MTMPSPHYKDGFWWWYDPARKGWFTGPSPEVQTPSWAVKSNLEPLPNPKARRGSKVPLE